jgi:hypothetical protein
METKKKKTVVFAPVLEEEKKQVLVKRENIIEDVILLLNPKYDHLFNDARYFFEDHGFGIIDYQYVTLTSKQATEIFARRYKSSSYKDDIIRHFTDEKSAFYHITKLNAYKEIDELMRRYFTTWPDVLEYKLIERPIKVESFPFVFIPMDSHQMYETALEIVFPEFYQFWGQDLSRMAMMHRDKVLNAIVQTTVGDSIKRGIAMSTFMIEEFFNDPKQSKSVHYVTTTPKQGMFEVRVQNKYGNLSSRKKVEQIRTRLLNKFHSLSMYYSRLCSITDDCCPSFYRFRIFPDSSSRLYRVFEVEEHTGEQFMYQILKEAQEHRKHETVMIGESTTSYLTQQGSLPAYSYGFKLAKLAEQLQEVTYNEIPEVGKIRFDKGEFLGSTLISEFYKSEKDYFRWLVDQVIPLVKIYTAEFGNERENRVDEFVEKFESILESHTFKESRKIHHIRLVPDKIDSLNLRIYNKSDFVTDVFLRELEEKLNLELESVAREKYFQGIAGGLDYSLVDKFERLKKGEEDFRRPNELLEEAKKRFIDDKHSTPKRLGSFYGRTKEQIEAEEVYARSQTIREMSKSWIDDTQADSSIPDLTDKRQDIVDKKGVAISGVVPAKYTKEHVAASLYFFINFTMREIKRDELLNTHILKNEKDLDNIIDSLTTAFQK